MNNILLCEGATDAILLSYYLEAVFGWRYCTPDKSINISEVLYDCFGILGEL